MVATKATLKDFLQIVEKPRNQYAIERAVAVDLDNAHNLPRVSREVLVLPPGATLLPSSNSEKVYKDSFVYIPKKF